MHTVNQHINKIESIDREEILKKKKTKKSPSTFQ